MTPRVAIVVQRFGADIGGGAEELARRIALLLAADMDVTVLTTCARDYRTWADELPAGPDDAEGVPVIRFPVPVPRDPAAFDALSARAYAAPEDLALGRRWIDAEGPVAPGLEAHLADHGGGYDAVVFFTYLYATTVRGLPLVADRAILVPTLHDEPPARLRVFDPVFDATRVLVFSTPEEEEFARARFGVPAERCRVIGVGVDPAPDADPGAARRPRPYAVCVGRLDPSKGTDALVAHHRAYRAGRPDGLDLVLVGTGPWTPPAAPWLTATGWVDDATKHALVAGAAVVVVPSPYESLSLAQLEAWTAGRPTLANAASPVLVGQSRRAAGGLWYRDGDEYAVMLDMLARNPALAAAIGRQGARYVRSRYTWDRVHVAWREAVGTVAAAARGARS